MFDLLKQFATFKLMKFKDNEIYLGGERLVLYYSPQLAWEQMFNYQLHGLDYYAARYLGAKVRVITFLDSYRGTLVKDLRSGADLCQKIMNNFGFGEFSIKKINEKTNFMWVHVKSTIAKDTKGLFGPQKEPIDFMYAGLFAGAAEYYIKKRMYCIELGCIAQKDVPLCEFVVGDKAKINDFLKKFNPKKIAWANEVIGKLDEIENKLLPNGIAQFKKKEKK